MLKKGQSRKFAVRLLCGALTVLTVSVLVQWYWLPHSPWLLRIRLAAGVLLLAGLLGLIWPRLIAPLQWVIEGLQAVVVQGAAWISLAVVYFAVVTPTGLILRAAGRNLLKRRHRPEGSNWEDVEAVPAPRRYSRQF